MLQSTSIVTGVLLTTFNPLKLEVKNTMMSIQRKIGISLLWANKCFKLTVQTNPFVVKRGYAYWNFHESCKLCKWFEIIRDTRKPNWMRGFVRKYINWQWKVSIRKQVFSMRLLTVLLLEIESVFVRMCFWVRRERERERQKENE